MVWRFASVFTITATFVLCGGAGEGAAWACAGAAKLAGRTNAAAWSTRNTGGILRMGDASNLFHAISRNVSREANSAGFKYNKSGNGWSNNAGI
jgi:hypothetical protein